MSLEQFLIEDLFNAMLKAEQSLSAAETHLADVQMKAKRDVIAAENALQSAVDAITSYMRENGLVEELIRGDHLDYKLSFSKPRGSVKAEPDAVPDEFVKIERKPKLREIGEYLNALAESGLDFPNWARIEYSEPKLQWKAIKKGAA